MNRLFFLLVVILFPESSWGLQTLFKGGSERVLSQSSRFPKRVFCTSTNNTPPLPPLNESHHKPPILEQTKEPSALSLAPRLLICDKVRASSRDRWSQTERVRVPFYAPELSQWVLNRRLSQLPHDVDASPFIETLKERFSYRDVWRSTTSNALFEDEGYQFVVHHISQDTKGYYYGIFDVFLKDAPLKLWLEGEMRVSDLRFEGMGIRDAYDLTYSYQVLRNELFPEGLLEDHFSGKKPIPEKDQPEDMKKLIEYTLHGDTLNDGILWGMRFIPFVTKE